MNNKKDYNKTLHQAGHIFMLTLRLEKIMIDLIVISQHKKIIPHFNKYNKSPTLGRERHKYRKFTLGNIIDIFVKEFNPSTEWINKLDEILFLRNAIGHSKPSMGSEYIFVHPSAKQLITQSEKRVGGRMKQIKINFFDENNYNTFFKYLTEIEENYFRQISSNLGINYKNIS